MGAQDGFYKWLPPMSMPCCIRNKAGKMKNRERENGHHRERGCDPLEIADSGQAINKDKLLMFVEHFIFLACTQLYILSNGMLSGQSGKGMDGPRTAVMENLSTHPGGLRVARPRSARWLSSPPS